MSGSSCIISAFLAAWPTIFALDMARYLAAAGLLVLILFAFRDALRHRRIQPRRAAAADIRREIGYSLSTVVLFSLVGVGVYLGSRYGYFRIYSGGVPPTGRLLVEWTAIVLLHDAFFYWAHRGMHTRWLFRRVHRLHHRSRTPTPWAAYAFAPAEALIEAAILPLAALLLPMHELTVLLFVTHMILRNVIGHAGVELFPPWWLDLPLLRLITTTTHHDLHHSHGGCNYGLYFTWWDRFMGTEHPDYHRRFRDVTSSQPAATSTVEETRS